MPRPEDFAIVLTTAGSDEQAEHLARALVERRLAACVNLVQQVCSVYRWKGEVQREGEQILLIKTSKAKFEALRAAIRELHSYEVPEVVMLPMLDVDADYLRWMEEELANAD
jgi:periplasmic divalent cation tolerance protein